MATIQTFNYADNSTLANFKAWAQSISNALNTFGWTKTADTGQVVWTTISTVPAVSTYVYEVWQSADALSSTLPIFLKLQYGTAATAAYPSVVITVGTGSNGSGTLTNASAAMPAVPSTAGGVVSPYECDFTGSTGRFGMVMFRSWNYVPFFFSVERAHDVNGNDLGTYFTYLCSTISRTPIQGTIFSVANGGPLATEANFISVQTNSVGAELLGTIMVCPIWPLVGKLDNPLLGALVVKAGDFADGVTFQSTMYTAAHTFIACPSIANSTTVGRTTSNSAIAMRWE